MAGTGSTPYQPQDTLYLWWTQDPAKPVLIGQLQLVRALRGVSLRYAPGWLTSGFPLSEDLPLKEGEFLPSGPETAAGAVDDARPDRWGERVIRFLDRPPRLSLMESEAGIRGNGCIVAALDRCSKAANGITLDHKEQHRPVAVNLQDEFAFKFK